MSERITAYHSAYADLVKETAKAKDFFDRIMAAAGKLGQWHERTLAQVAGSKFVSGIVPDAQSPILDPNGWATGQEIVARLNAFRDAYVTARQQWKVLTKEERLGLTAPPEPAGA